MKVVCQIIASGLFTISQYVLLVVLAKVYGTAGLGEYAFIMALCAPIYMFCDGNMRALIATDIEYDIVNSFYGSIKAILLLLGTLVSLIVILVNSNSSLLLVLSILMLKVTENIAQSSYGARSREADHSIICKSLLVRAIAYFCVLIPALSGLGLSQAVLFVAIVLVIGCIFSDFPVFSDFHKRFCFRSLDRLEKKAIQKIFLFGTVFLLVSFRISMPAYFIESRFDLVALGVYSGFYYVTVALSRPTHAAYNASLSDLKHHIANNRPRKIVYLYGLVILLAILMFLFAQFIINFNGGYFLNLVFNNDFAKYLELLVLLSLGMPFIHIGTVFIQSSIAFEGINVQLMHALLTLSIMTSLLFFADGSDNLNTLGKVLLIESILFFLTSFCFLLFTGKRYRHMSKDQ